MGNKRSYKKLIISFWMIFITGVVASVMFFYAIANWELFGPLPSIEELENPETHQATEVFSSDGKVIGTFFAENRSNIDFSEISPNVINGLIATEDERFYSHSGIDLRSLARAVSGGGGGGSTITQQLAKMLFTGVRSKNVFEAVQQKFKEWVVAVQLEKRYTKQEILALYLNKFDYVYNAAGIKSAAKVYFNKNANDLSLVESAVLVGMAKNPVLYNPKKNPKNALKRRNTVLFQMLRNEMITRSDFDSLKQIPIQLDFQRQTHTAGIGTYFREVLRKDIGKLLNGTTKADGSNFNVYRDGLKIYTTIDSRMQNYAESAMKRYLGGHLQKLFFKRLKGRSNAPFTFEDMEPSDIKNTVKGIYTAGMRNSSRYLKAQEHYPEVVKPKRKYNRTKTKQNRLINKKKAYERERESVQVELNRLNRNNSGRGVIVKLIKDLKSRKTIILDSLKTLKKEISDMQPEVDELWDKYYKYWKPFDDSMKVVFKKKVNMEVFSWNGSIDTVMSPIDSVKYHKWFLRSGMMSMEPSTGYVKAWVGGPNYKHFKYDHVRQGRRQVGSTFKPFVYATGIENGVSPCERVLNIPTTIPAGKWGLLEDWTPENASNRILENQWLTMKMALANSVNTVSAYHMNQYGPNEVIRIARKFGLTGNIDPVPSICLGTADASLYEMVGAYSAFVNKGTWIEPVYVLKIEDKFGNAIYEHSPKIREAMSEENAYKMVQLLSGVAEYGPRFKDPETGKMKSTFGTGIRLRMNVASRDYDNIPDSIKIAGKTGTTQNQSDGWFMGMTNDLVSGVWVGCEDRSAHFLTTDNGSGTNMALPIWAYYMHDVWNDEELSYEGGEFDVPESLRHVNFDCSEDAGPRKSGSVGSGNPFED